MNILLTRDHCGTDCTLGRLIVNGDSFHTIERPWVFEPNAPCGKKGISCVPPGIYRLIKHTSEAHPKTWALVNPSRWVYHFDEDVPAGQHGLARTEILIHSANWAAELMGCIAPGLGRLKDHDKWMVTASRKAMAAIQSMMTWTNDHSIEIAV